ncbi:MAG: hypothetical protein WCV68_04490 [Candidatus Paceibacterota bacterium]
MSPRKVLGAVSNAFNSEKFDGLATTSVAVLNRLNTYTATNTFSSIDMIDGNVYRYNGRVIAQASTTLYNYFFGNSGNLTMTGNSNTGVGQRSLINNVGGYLNTGVGAGSLEQNVDGVENTAFGALTLSNNVSGNFNTAMGYQTLYWNSTSTGNTAVGFQAGWGSSTASTSNQINSLFGYQSGLNLETGSNNNAFGFESGFHLTTGGNNVLLGSGAGYWLTTGSNNIFIGNNASTTIADTSNTLNIGNTLYGNLSLGNIGIGTTTPGEKLVVANGSINSFNEYNNGANVASSSFKSTSYLPIDSLGFSLAEVGVYGQAHAYNASEVTGVGVYGDAVGNLSIAGLFNASGANSEGLEIYANGTSSTGALIRVNGLNSTGLNVDVDNGAYGLFVNNASTTRHSVYSTGGLNYFGGMTTMGNLTTNTQFNLLDVGGGLLVPQIKFTSPDTASLNSGIGVFSNHLAIVNFDTNSSYGAALSFQNGLGSIPTPIIYSTSSDDALSFAGATAYNFDQDVVVDGTVMATCFSNDGGLNCITGGSGVGISDSFWSTSSLTSMVLHPNVSNSYPVVIGDNATTSSAIFEVNGDAKLRSNLAVGGILTLSPLANRFLSVNGSGQIIATTTPIITELDPNIGPYIVASTSLPAFLNYWTKTGSNLSYVAGNVGIGTTSPITTLSVTGHSYVTGSSTASEFLAQSDTPIMRLYDDVGTSANLRILARNGINYIQSGTSTLTNSSAPLYFSNINAGQAWMSISENGKVGIGTTSPFYKFEVLDGTNGFIRIIGPANAADSGPGIKLYENLSLDTAPAGFDLFVESSVNRFDIRSFSNSLTPVSRFSILRDNGYVGIGTSSPIVNLSVVGNQEIDNGGLYFESDGGGDRAIFTPLNNDLIFNLRGNAGNEGVTFEKADGTDFLQIDGINSNVTLTGSGNEIALIGSDTQTIPKIHFRETTGDDWYIAHDGNNLNFREEADAYDRVTFAKGGYVGIGTTSPIALLSVSNGAANSLPSFIVENTNAGGYTVMDINRSNSLRSAQINFTTGLTNDWSFGVLYAGGAANSGLSFQYGSNMGSINSVIPTLHLTTTGYVGIGTTTPTALLSIAGDGKDYFRISSSTNPNVMVVNSKGQFFFNTDSEIFDNAVSTNHVTFKALDSIKGSYLTISQPAETTSGGTSAGITFAEGNDDYWSVFKRTSHGVTGASAVTDVSDSLNFSYGTSTDGAARNVAAMTISTSSYIGLGTTTPRFTLVVGSGAVGTNATLQVPRGGICVTNDGWCNAPTAGTINTYVLNTNQTDLAENYPIFENDISPGYIVSVSSSNNSSFKHELGFGVKKAQSDEAVIGIISTSPGITLGGSDSVMGDGQTPVALSGRVPVKVNLEGGPIAAGDYVTLSSVPGVGTKATSSSQMVGIALESFSHLSVKDANGVGEVMVFVNLGYKHIAAELGQGQVNTSELWSVDGDGQIKISSSLNLSNQDITNVRSILSASGNWSISGDGTLIVKTIKTETAIIENGVTVRDRTTGSYSCIFVDGGVVKTEPGECSSSSTGDNSLPPSSGGTDDGGEQVVGTSTDALPEETTSSSTATSAQGAETPVSEALIEAPSDVPAPVVVEEGVSASQNP